MKILMQTALIFGVFWVCQGIEVLLPIPMPASVISLILMLVLLCCKVIREEHMQETADFLMGNLAFFFVPAAVGIIEYVDVICQNTAAFFTICVVSTVLTFGATVGVVQLTRRFLDGREKK